MPKKTLSGQGIGRKVLKAIEDAKRRIYVISPYISSDYAKLLIKKGQEGVDVRVITSKESRTFSTAVLSLYSGKISKEDLEVFEMHKKELLFLVKTLLTICFVVTTFLALAITKTSLSPLVEAGIVIASAIFPITVYASYYAYPVLSYVGLGWAGAAIIIMLLKPEWEHYALVSFLIVSPLFLVLDNMKLQLMRSYIGIIREFGEPRKLISVKFFPREKYVHSKIYIADDVGFSGSVNLTFKSINQNVETLTIYEGDDLAEIEKIFQDIWRNTPDNPINIILDIYSAE